MELCNKKNHHFIEKEQSGSDLTNHNLYYYRNSAKFPECLLLFPTFVEFTKQNNCRITQYCLMEFLLTGPTVVSRRVIQASHLPFLALLTIFSPPCPLLSQYTVAQQSNYLREREREKERHYSSAYGVTSNMLSG